MNKRYISTILTLAIGLLCPALVLAQAAEECPDVLKGQYGPYDYMDPDVALRQKYRETVEPYHFTPKVATLRGGQSAPIEADIGYTIRAFPNHYPALDALSRLSLTRQTTRMPLAGCTVEGYFERAIRFKPNDARVHMAYGLHLYRWKKVQQAKEQLLEAERLAPDDTNNLYNLGLVYADLGDWDRAMNCAPNAYGAGFPLPGLRNKLVKAGKWRASAVVETGSASTQAGESKPTESKQ